MSSTTSEERREAAANLRKIHLGGANKDLMELMLSDAIGAWHENGISWDYITERLADLLDPTCEVMEVPDNDEFMIRVVSGFMCKRCGHEAIVERNCDGSAEPPKYCPHCGARVVDGGDA